MTMNEQEKGRLMGLIIGKMRQTAESRNKFFDAGDFFFSLAFRTDDQLRMIAKECEIKV